MAHYLLKNEGLFLGGSAGLNVVGAGKSKILSMFDGSVWLAKKLGPGHVIVTILCDSGNNYRSKMYNSKWLEENQLEIQRTTAEEFVESWSPNKIKVSLD